MNKIIKALNNICHSSASGSFCVKTAVSPFLRLSDHEPKGFYGSSSSPSQVHLGTS